METIRLALRIRDLLAVSDIEGRHSEEWNLLGDLVDLLIEEEKARLRPGDGVRITREEVGNLVHLRETAKSLGANADDLDGDEVRGDAVAIIEYLDPIIDRFFGA
jgi:hypothetical protein